MPSSSLVSCFMCTMNHTNFYVPVILLCHSPLGPTKWITSPSFLNMFTSSMAGMLVTPILLRVVVSFLSSAQPPIEAVSREPSRFQPQNRHSQRHSPHRSTSSSFIVRRSPPSNNKRSRHSRREEQGHDMTSVIKPGGGGSQK